MDSLLVVERITGVVSVFRSDVRVFIVSMGSPDYHETIIKQIAIKTELKLGLSEKISGYVDSNTRRLMNSIKKEHEEI